MNTDHTSLLAKAARTYVNAAAILTIHRGGTWQDTAWPSMSAGGAGNGLSYWTDRRGVTYSHTFRGHPIDTVTWAELADVVRHGVTDELATDISTAYRGYVDAMFPPHDGSEVARRDASAAADHDGSPVNHLRELRRLEQLVTTRGLDATPTQLDLFPIGA